MTITTRNGAFQNRAKGLGYRFPIITTSSAGTAPAAASGFISVLLGFNAIGSTTPGTLVSIPIPTGLSNELYPSMVHYQNSGAGQRSCFTALLYKLGTVDLANAAAAPYDGFTHNANFTGPLTRTLCGVSTNVQLIPLIYITTATTTTAPAFILQATTGPGNGYKNQAGTSVIGTKTFTCPNVATAAGSTYVLRLEDGDSAITDLTQVSVTIKSSTGVATMFGVELLLGAASGGGGYGGLNDTMLNGLSMSDMSPATPTTGSLTVGTDYYLAQVVFGAVAAVGTSGFLVSTLNV